MKKIVSVILLILLLYIMYKIVISIFFKEFDYTYSLEKDGISVKINQKSNDYNYYLEFVHDGTKIKSEVILNTNERKEQVEDIRILKKDNILCIYPIIEENSVDVLCNIKKKNSFYSSIRGKYKDVDLFIEQLKKEGYSYNSW